MTNRTKKIVKFHLFETCTLFLIRKWNVRIIFTNTNLLPCNSAYELPKYSQTYRRYFAYLEKLKMAIITFQRLLIGF